MTSSTPQRSVNLPAPGLSRRVALTGSLGLVAAAVLASCSESNPEDEAFQATSGEMLIGVCLELTGAGAAMAKLQKQALIVGAEALNAIGIPFGSNRLRVQLIIEDNDSDPQRAAELATRMIEVDKVSAIIGGTLLETARAMLAVAEPRKVPLLCLTNGEELTRPVLERRFIYQLAPNSSDIAELLAATLQTMDLNNVVVVRTGDGHGANGATALPRALHRTGRDLVDVLTLPKSTRRYEELAADVVAANPDAVIVWALAPNSAVAVGALREAGYEGRIFLDPAAVADDTLSGPHGDAMEGAHVVHSTVLSGPPLHATSPSGRAARDFIYRYIQKYGTFSGFAPYGADALNLLATAARRSVSVNPLRLRGRLEAGPQEGISGAYSFQPIAHGGLDPDALALYVVQHNDWVRV